MKAVDRTGIEVVDGDECLRLLRGRRVGRVGIVVAGEPLILPVNYAVLDETMAEGTPLTLATQTGTVSASAAAACRPPCRRRAPSPGRRGRAA